MRMQRSVHFLLFLFVLLAIPATSFAQIGVSITVAPPELVAYSQPICPQQGYLWTPGYWAYGRDGYFWVPGTWVEPPTVGLSGHLVTGVGVMTHTFGTRATGVPPSDFTAALTMVMATVVPAMKVGTGETTSSTTTDR